MTRNFALLAIALLAAHARAEDSAPKPDENALFGGEAPTENKRDAFASGEVTENPLQLGGIYYQRGIASLQSGGSLGTTPITAPLQFDAFMDGRPNDRIRAFVDGRLLYDPTRDAYGNATGGSSFGSQQFSTTSAAPSSVFAPTLIPNNPQVVLDQAWLKFDVERALFITVGKQHVKWGPGRFWNPTDFLNTQRRDPLLPYDLRLGNAMVKLELPWESKKTNFYAILLADNPQPASTLGQLGVAVRGETLLGPAEIGVEVVARGGTMPVYGADFSSPLGPFDVYLEGSCLSGAPASQYDLVGTATPGADLTSLYSITNPTGPYFQLTAGANYDFAWRPNRQATLGAEYFYNQVGQTTASAYPILIFQGQYQPFYAARNYAAIFLTAEGPDAEKHTNYTFSGIANLADYTVIGRIDFSWRILTYLTLETYVDAHFGHPGGEFNFAINTPALTFQGQAIPPINLPSTLADAGFGLRVSF
jgi:hypothetical protein